MDKFKLSKELSDILEGKEISFGERFGIEKVQYEECDASICLFIRDKALSKTKRFRIEVKDI